jgi:hypothetical protein
MVCAEDEKKAAEKVSSEPTGTGYMVLALQEQLMQLR